MKNWGKEKPCRADQVLRLAALGWQLFPVKERGKEPLIADWPNQASNDKGRLRFWLSRFANCNWGVATGPASGVFVLDVDGEQGKQSLRDLEAQSHEFPRTLIAHTGRGAHLYLMWPPNGAAIRNSAGKIAPGLDVRGSGGYAIVPPSIHSSGTGYEFVNENAPVAPAPEWLLEILAQPYTAAETSAATAQASPGTIPQGQRNSTLTSHAGAMRRKGMPATAIEAALLAENKDCCVPQLSEHEVRAIAQSASRYEPATAKGSAALQTGVREWPAPLGAEAFQGLAGEFVRLVGPETEADESALLFSYLVTVGSIIGRGPYYQVGGDRHYTNLFAVIVGQSAKARKGTSWGEVRRFVEMLDEGWCRQRVAGGLSSGEGLIHAVRDPIVEMVALRDGKRVIGHEEQTTDTGVDDKRLIAVEGELSQVLQAAGRDGNTLSAIIRQAWDGGPLRVLAKNAKGACLEHHISVLAHITSTELQRQLTTTDMANGFANRFLWICAARSKHLPFGGAVNDRSLSELADKAREAITFAATVKQVGFAVEARPEWERVYPALSEGRPGLSGAITARAEAQTVRLALLYAVLDQSGNITLPHLRAALAAWRYCEDSARFIFGDSLGDPTADAILNLLLGNAEGLTRNEITDHFKRNKSSAELGRALAVLQENGKARLERHETAGRPADVWKAVASRHNNQKYEKYEINEISPP